MTIEEAKHEAQQLLDFLTSMPGGNTTCRTAVLRELLLRTDGWLMVNGKRYEIVGKSLGAGVYRVFLEKLLP